MMLFIDTAYTRKRWRVHANVYFLLGENWASNRFADTTIRTTTKKNFRKFFPANKFVQVLGFSLSRFSLLGEIPTVATNLNFQTNCELRLMTTNVRVIAFFPRTNANRTRTLSNSSCGNGNDTSPFNCFRCGLRTWTRLRDSGTRGYFQIWTKQFDCCCSRIGQRTNVSGSVTMAANVLNDSLLVSWNVYNTTTGNNSLGPNYSFYSLDLYPLLAYSVD